MSCCAQKTGLAALAEHPGIILFAYLCALLPLAAIYALDFIDENWRTIRATRRRGQIHLAFSLPPLTVVIFYIHIQRLDEDFKEMAAGITAAILCILHIARTLWGLLQLRAFKEWNMHSLHVLNRLGFLEKRYFPRSAGCSAGSETTLTSENEPSSNPLSKLLHRCNQNFRKLLATWKIRKCAQPETSQVHVGFEDKLSSDGIEETVDSHMIVNSSLIDNEFVGAELPCLLNFWIPRNPLPKRELSICRFLTCVKPDECAVQWVVSFLSQFGSEWLIHTKTLENANGSKKSLPDSLPKRLLTFIACNVTQTVEAKLKHGEKSSQEVSILSPLHVLTSDLFEPWTSTIQVTDKSALPYQMRGRSGSKHLEFADYSTNIRNAISAWHEDSLNKLNEDQKSAVMGIGSHQVAFFSKLLEEKDAHLLPIRFHDAQFCISRREKRRLNTLLWQFGHEAVPLGINEIEVGEEVTSSLLAALPFPKESLDSVLKSALYDVCDVLQASVHADNWIALEAGNMPFACEETKLEGSNFEVSQVFNTQKRLEFRRLQLELAKAEGSYAQAVRKIRFVGCIMESVRSSLADWLYEPLQVAPSEEKGPVSSGWAPQFNFTHSVAPETDEKEGPSPAGWAPTFTFPSHAAPATAENNGPSPAGWASPFSIPSCTAPATTENKDPSPAGWAPPFTFSSRATPATAEDNGPSPAGWAPSFSVPSCTAPATAVNKDPSPAGWTPPFSIPPSVAPGTAENKDPRPFGWAPPFENPSSFAPVTARSNTPDPEPVDWNPLIVHATCTVNCSNQLNEALQEAEEEVVTRSEADTEDYRLKSLHMRILWEIQLTLLRSRVRSPGSQVMMMLCMLGYPSLRVSKVNNCLDAISTSSRTMLGKWGESAGDVIVPLPESESSDITHVQSDLDRGLSPTCYRIDTVEAPQQLHIRFIWDSESKNADLKICSNEGYQVERFCWQTWKDGFMGRLAAQSEWRSRRLLMSDEGIRKEVFVSKISEGISRPRPSERTITYWRGWSPFLSKIAKFEMAVSQSAANFQQKLKSPEDLDLELDRISGADRKDSNEKLNNSEDGDRELYKKAQDLFTASQNDEVAAERCIEAFEFYLVQRNPKLIVLYYPGAHFCLALCFFRRYCSIGNDSDREIGTQHLLASFDHPLKMLTSPQSRDLDVAFLLERGSLSLREYEKIKAFRRSYNYCIPDGVDLEEMLKSIFLFSSAAKYQICKNANAAFTIYLGIVSKEKSGSAFLPRALNRLALMHHMGHNIGEKNIDEAKELYIRAFECEKEDTFGVFSGSQKDLHSINALCNLSVWYGQHEEGEEGGKESVKLLNRAMEAAPMGKHSSSMNNLAVLKEAGKHVVKNVDEAKKLYERSVEIDENPIAMYNLAVLLKFEDPTPHNLAEAEILFSKLFDLGVDLQSTPTLQSQLQKARCLPAVEISPVFTFEVEEIDDCLAYVKIVDNNL